MPSSTFRFFAGLKLLSLGSHDLTTIVVAASLASSVGHDGLTALGANGHAGSGQLPVGATALIAAGRGHFTLRDSHGDTSLVKLLFTAFIMDLLLKKLLQSSKSGIELLLATAGTVVQVLAATAAETFAVLLAQQLGIQIQDENCPHNVIQIGAVSLQREYPFIFIIFVGQLRYQHHIDGHLHITGKVGSATVANAMQASADRSRHHHHAGSIANNAFRTNGFRHGVASTISKISQIQTGRKRNARSGTINDFRQS